MNAAAYPVRLEARLDEGLSRWLWLVKWVLVIPHAIVLAVLWVGFVLATLGAWVAILVTGRFPRRLFAYDLGVLRWTWRVHYYAYGGLATDRYPPFTLADVEDYPARLDLARPERVSRLLALVRGVLVLPQLLVLALLLGGGWGAWHLGGAVGVLALVAAVVLAATGSYPRPLYDVLLGLNRWAFRVVAYAALMTDVYPPFRLDPGEREPSL